MKPQLAKNLDIPLVTGLSALLVILAASTFMPATWFWGLNHGTWLSWPLRFALPTLGLLIIWSNAGTRLGEWLSGWLSPRILGNRAVAFGIVPALGTLVFWFFRDRTHMLGDGQTLAVMLAGDNLYHGFDFMTYHLIAKTYQALGAGGETAAFQVTAVISCLCGALYLGTAAWSARRLAEDPGARIILYLLLIFFAPLQMFFGYMEVYAPLSIALLVFLTFFMAYQNNRGTLVAVSAAWSAALFFHLNALFLAPLLAVALFVPPSGEKRPLLKRVFIVVGPIIGALVLAGIIYGAGGYGYDRFLTDFGHVDRGSGILVPLTGLEGLFSLRHFKDILNLWLLLAGVPIVLLATARRPDKDALHRILLAGSLYLMTLPLIIHMKLGPARDWDLFAPHMTLLVLAGWYASIGDRKSSSRLPALTGPVAIAAIVIAVPWFVINAGQDRALARLEAVATDMSPYAHGLLHEQFAYHHQMAGNEDEVLRHYKRCGEVCPGNPRFHAIYGTFLLNRGDMTEAAAAYDRSVATDSTYVYGLKMAVMARVLNRNYASALEPARRLAALGGQDAEAATAHGTAAENTGHRGEAIGAYRRAAALDPSRVDLLERAAGLQLMERDFEEAEAAFRDIRRLHPTRTSADLGLADAIWQGFLADPEGRAAEENIARLAQAAGLIDKIIVAGMARGESNERLAAWRDEVRARQRELAR